MSLADRLLSRVGLTRKAVATQAARTAQRRGVQAGAQQAARVFAAAQVTRLTGDWNATILSPEQEQKGALKRMRGAARAYERDHAYGERFLNLVSENLIGHEGIRPQVRKESSRKRLDVELNTKTEQAWMRWGLPENCSLDQRLSWLDTEHLVARTLARDGEILVRHVEGADNEFGYAVQLLDADLLDDEYSSQRPDSRGHRIRQGVEEDAQGRVVAYHLWTNHPSEYGTGTQRRERVDAKDIEHLFLVKRLGQRRGYTWFAPVLVDSNSLGAYQEAEVTAARIAASKLYTISYDAEEGAAPRTTEPGEREILDDVEPGQGVQLLAGEQLNPIEWSHPNTQFHEFATAILHSVAAGLNVSHSSLTGDLRSVNYSSIRTGSIQERDFWRRLQSWLAMHLHRRVFNRWLKFAALHGHIPAREVDGYLDVDWQPRGWDWVDPMKDMEASAMAVACGLDTRSRVLAARGLDYEDVVQRLAEEKRIADEAGVTLTTPYDAPAADREERRRDTGAADATLPDDAGRAAAGGLRLARRL